MIRRKIVKTVIIPELFSSAYILKWYVNKKVNVEKEIDELNKITMKLCEYYKVPVCLNRLYSGINAKIEYIKEKNTCLLGQKVIDDLELVTILLQDILNSVYSIEEQVWLDTVISDLRSVIKSLKDKINKVCEEELNKNIYEKNESRYSFTR